MSGFLLFCLLCLGALPVMLAWYTGVELIGPLLWRARLLGQAHRGPRALPAHVGLALSPSTSPEVRAALDEATASRASPYTRDFAATVGGLPVYLRTQARVVDKRGGMVGIPYTLAEQNETRSVVAVFAVVDLRGRVPKRLTFHVDIGDEQRTFGDEGLVAGLLDGQTRGHLGRGDRLSLVDRFLLLESPFLLADRSPEPVVDQIARLGARLARVCEPKAGPPDIAALLEENLRRDLSEQVRADAADLLIARFPSRADRAAAAALADRSALVRFAAARHLGDEGFQILEQVAFDRAQVGSAADGLRQRALRFLVREFPREQVLPLLERAIRSGPDALRQIAIRQVGELGHRPAVAWLGALARSQETDTVAAGCEALARIGDPAGESLLIELLDRPEPVVVRAAVDALAQIGTVASAAPLSRLFDRASERDLRLSLATTLQLVRTRGAPEALGALSLVEEGAGQLALSPPDVAEER